MKTQILFFIFLFSIVISYANNLEVSNIAVDDADNISFDISWDNAWYDADFNWDAVWIFVKAQDCSGTKKWEHVDLSSSDADHSVTGGLYVQAVSDGKGVFVRLDDLALGSQSGTVTLQFDSSIANYEDVNFQVYGIEMVWVPEGSFYVGDGSTSSGQSHYSFGSNGGNAPRTISSENAIPANHLHKSWWDNGWPYRGRNHASIPAAFPKGYASFYCMKYEISQDQYVAFLNSLTSGQQANRIVGSVLDVTGTLVMTSAAQQNRNSIVIETPSVGGAPAVFNVDLNGDGTYGDGGSIAMNYLNFEDLKAYLDWSALRPMTELEYEKAARGSDYPVISSYAWGSTAARQAVSSSLSNGGETNELSTNSGDGLAAANGGSSSSLGPLRVGFAATATTNRLTAGASYWGIMDMSGNVWEQTYSVGKSITSNATANPASLTFSGNHGDGEISVAGAADVANWPVANSGGQRYAIVRGGSWENGWQDARVSDRSEVDNNADAVNRTRRTGGRGVRSSL